ncbi:hypothetical protein CCFV1_ORF004 [Cotesia congregata filamentous virus 1]|uniref:Uncharacterized protein n=1 Tax=Cotesia congregata filamentous virus 1 TaxID=3064291 RepID=A0ABC8QMR5_9VIRU|nr:hypothetical protein CCFV1_ORF004 [Cotesia congregata filamentous virus 1]
MRGLVTHNTRQGGGVTSDLTCLRVTLIYDHTPQDGGNTPVRPIAVIMKETESMYSCTTNRGHNERNRVDVLMYDQSRSKPSRCTPVRRGSVGNTHVRPIAVKTEYGQAQHIIKALPNRIYM